MEQLHVRGDLVAKAITALRGNLLDGRTVWLETEGTRGQAHLTVRLCRGVDFTAATITGINPAVGCHDKVVGHEVGIAGCKAAVEDLLLVRLAVSIRIPQPDDVGLADDDDAILVMAETRDEFEAFVEELFLVGHAVAIRVDQHADLILGRAIIAAGHQHPALAPGFGGQRPAAVRVFRGLGNPHPPAFIPLHRDGFVDERLGGRDISLEAWL